MSYHRTLVASWAVEQSSSVNIWNAFKISESFCIFAHVITESEWMTDSTRLFIDERVVFERCSASLIGHHLMNSFNQRNNSIRDSIELKSNLNRLTEEGLFSDWENGRKPYFQFNESRWDSPLIMASFRWLGNEKLTRLRLAVNSNWISIGAILGLKWANLIRSLSKFASGGTCLVNFFQHFSFQVLMQKFAIVFAKWISSRNLSDSYKRLADDASGPLLFDFNCNVLQCILSVQI